jgi:hypothetical protein
LEVGIGGVIVRGARGEPGLIEYGTGVDAFIDEMDGDAEIAVVSFRFCPIASMNATIFRRHAGMVVDERRIDGMQDIADDDTGAHHENRARLQSPQMVDAFG